MNEFMLSYRTKNILSFDKSKKFFFNSRSICLLAYLYFVFLYFELQLSFPALQDKSCCLRQHMKDIDNNSLQISIHCCLFHINNRKYFFKTAFIYSFVCSWWIKVPYNCYSIYTKTNYLKLYFNFDWWMLCGILIIEYYSAPNLT